jgi:hypothetical protein
MAANEGFSGMGNLIRSLQRLPEELKDEAEGIVNSTADLFKADLDAEYGKHVVTGNLVGQTRADRSEPLRVRVRNTARHAEMFERGTVQRFTARTGANRGRMPVGNVFIPRAIRWRQTMVGRLRALLVKARVQGMTGSPEVRET